MKYKLLLVDDSPEILVGYERLLGREFDVRTAATCRGGLEACVVDGPFAVVVADYDMPDMEGTEFLQVVHQKWPETVKVMMTGIVNVEVAVRALNQGRIFRFLQKPCPADYLGSSLNEAVEEYEQRVSDREYRDQLVLSRDTLLQFTGSLEKRVSKQTRTLARLHRFAISLNAARSLGEIAGLAAEVTTDVLSDRGVQVELTDGLQTETKQRAAAGPAVSAERLSQAVQSRDGRVGSILVNMLDERGNPPSDTDRHMLASIASSTAVATHNRIRSKERDDAQQATILALAKLAERRDNETGKHLERVSRYCQMIAEGLRADGNHVDVITDDYIRDLYICAPLHDIGKVGIPDRILLKQGKLDDDEWETMKTHAEIGAETLRHVMEEHPGQSFLQMSLNIAWCHHEKWDGSGYPRALLGEQIPLAARILALADVYDALTTVRPYKLAWSHQRAFEWVCSRRGSHFDPDVVTAFENRSAQADRIRSDLADTIQDLHAAPAPVPSARTG